MSSGRTREHKGVNGKKTKAELVQELKDLKDKIDLLTSEQGLKDKLLEGNLKAVLDSLPVGVSLYDKNGRAVEFNGMVDRIWGLNAPLPQSILEFSKYKGWFADSGEPVQAEEWTTPRAIKSGKGIFGDVFDIQRFDGTRGSIMISTAPLKDSESNITGWVAVIQDITERRRMEEEIRRSRDELNIRVLERTSELQSSNVELIAQIEERKRAEEALRESEGKYRLIVENASEGIWIAKQSGITTFVNKRMAEMLGYSVDEMIGKYVYQYVDNGHICTVESNLEKRKSGMNLTSEYAFLRKNGSLLWAISNSTPLLDMSGKFMGTLAIITDITERKKAEEALRESEARFRSVLDNSRDVIYRLNVQTGHYEYISPSCEAVVGYSSDELMSMDAETGLTMIHPDDLPAMRTAVATMNETGEAEAEYRQRAKDGEYRWLSNWMSLTRDSSGRPLYRNGNIRDITERKRADEALHESRANLERVFAAIPDVIVEYATDGRLVRANDMALKLAGVTLGNTRDYIVNKLEFRNLDGSPMKRDDFPTQRALHGEMVKGEQYRVRTPGGEERIVSSYANPLYKGEQISGVVGILHDITEMKLTETALMQSEQRLNNILNSIQDGFFELDREYRYTYINQKAAKNGGLEPGDYIGNCNWDMFPYARGTKFEAVYGEVMETRRPAHFEIKSPSMEQYYDINVYPSVGGISVFWKDITERKRVEETIIQLNNDLKRRVTELQTLFELLPMSIGITDDPECKKIYANKVFEKLVGVPYGSNISQSAPADAKPGFKMFLNGREIPKEELPLHKAAATGKPVYGASFDAICADSRVISFYGHAVPLFDEEGKPRGAIGVFDDMTERTRNEKALAEAKMQAELYLDLMGHDISNMHQIAMGQLELANEIMGEEGGLTAEEKELIEKPLETLNRSARLIENVRNLQRMRRGEFKEERIDLNDLLSNIVKEHEFLLPSNSIRFVGRGPNPVKANKLLHDVFSNIVGNAIKHSNSNGININIVLENADEGGKNYYKVSIEDTGSGIPDEMKDRIFNRLQRGDTKARGLGLGLYIVKSLVDSYNGRVWVEDRIQGDHTKGSRFVVLLPVVEDRNGC
jgi:PAS domain S-box-containing protein